MKKLTTFFLALVCATGMFAQKSSIPTVLEVVTIDSDEDDEQLQVINIPNDGVNNYFLHVGTMGIGNKIIQINVDPVDRLYIPLGNNLTDAIKKLEELKTLYKEPKGTMREIQGSFRPFFPGEASETIQVYRHQPLLTNQLQFVLARDGYDRVAYASASSFKSLLSSLKLYGKMHRKEM